MDLLWWSNISKSRPTVATRYPIMYSILKLVLSNLRITKIIATMKNKTVWVFRLMSQL